MKRTKFARRILAVMLASVMVLGSWSFNVLEAAAHTPNRIPATGPRSDLEQDVDVLVNQFGQRLFGSPNEHAAASYIAQRFRDAGSNWEVVQHRWNRSEHPADWPANTRTQPFTGRLAFEGNLPDIYGAPFPNTGDWNNGASIEDALLVDLGTYPNLTVPAHILPYLDALGEDETLPVLGAIRYVAYPHVDWPTAARHHFDVAVLGPAIEALEMDYDIEVAGILLAAAGRQDPAVRGLVDYNIESLITGTPSANHGMGAPMLPDAAANTPRPLITTSLYFQDLALERADQFQYAHQYHRLYDNTVIATRPATSGDPDLIIVMTAHIDSVLASPGAADNASGTAALLEIARRFADVDLGNIELRLAAVGSHEGGGMTGSRTIVDSLTPEERAITMNLNMDIIASVGPSLIDGRPINAISMDIFGTADLPFQFNLPAHLVVSSARDVWGPRDVGIDNVRIFPFGGSEHTVFSNNGLDAASMIMIDDAENDLEIQYHNSRDNTEENYCYDRLRLSTGLMINAIERAVDQQVTKRATFHVDLANSRLILANAATMYQTFDQVDGELVINHDGVDTIVPFTFEYPDTVFDFSELFSSTDEIENVEYTIRDVVASGTGIADHRDEARNSELNRFSSRTVAEILPMPAVISVTVTPATAAVYQSESQQFAAAVEGINDPPEEVVWSVAPGSVEPAAGTSITADGLLTLASDQEEGTLTVRATSVFDNEVYGEATVTVLIEEEEEDEEEDPDPETSPGDSTQTGDNSPILMLFIIVLASLGTIVALVVRKVKKAKSFTS